MILAEIDTQLEELQKQYREAVYRESAIREVSFLPITLDICGVEVNQFTPRHFIFLDFLQSPFTTGKGSIAVYDIIEFLWIVSVDYKNNCPEKKAEFTKKLEDKDTNKLAEEILQYIADAFSDRPPKVGLTNNKETQIPYYAWVCSYVDLLANEYGWRDDYIVDMPLSRMFQYSKAIEARKAFVANTKPVLFNNMSDEVKGKIRTLLRQKGDLEKGIN